MQYIDAKYDLLINGEWVPAEGGETFETFNPCKSSKDHSKPRNEADTSLKSPV